MKKAIDLSIAAGRKRQSLRTQFIHLVDTIPLFENFCFTFALFREKSVESGLEGKALLRRLLAFQAPDGNFPTYLHDFPTCYDSWMGLRIAPILIQIERHFGVCIEKELKGKISFSLERIIAHASTLRLPPLWEHRLQKIRGEEANFVPHTQEEWFQWLVSEQLGEKPIAAKIPYVKGLQVFVGGAEVQEGEEVSPCAMEWMLAEKEGFTPRLLQDHSAMIPLALLLPIETARVIENHSPFWIEDPPRLLWMGKKLHSLSIPGMRNGIILEGDVAKDPFEVALFCDLSSETDVFIQGQKGTVFAMGDTVQIQTPSLTTDVSFHLLEGEGIFCGHVTRSNRPAQIACKGALAHAVFDWQIALRTIRRGPFCRIALNIKVRG